MVGLSRIAWQARVSSPVSSAVSNQRRNRSGSSGPASTSISAAGSSAPICKSLSIRARNSVPCASASAGGSASAIINSRVSCSIAGRVSDFCAAMSAASVSCSLEDHSPRGRPEMRGAMRPTASGEPASRGFTDTCGAAALSATGVSSGVAGGADVTERDSQSMAESGSPPVPASCAARGWPSASARTRPARLTARSRG
ncbi:hypothetical protein [Limimaricola sp.]|uniref:hypothetical protein n=1 Tax=Limimaricola sp. TaxID=2211665 RepID=UPI0040597CAC